MYLEEIAASSGLTFSKEEVSSGNSLKHGASPCMDRNLSDRFQFLQVFSAEIGSSLILKGSIVFKKEL